MELEPKRPLIFSSLARVDNKFALSEAIRQFVNVALSVTKSVLYCNKLFGRLVIAVQLENVEVSPVNFVFVSNMPAVIANEALLQFVNV